MCDPTLVVAGIQTVGRVAEINEQNVASDKNAAMAVKAGNDEMAAEQLSFAEKNRSLLQGGFDAILEGRAAESEAYTSAIENGVQGASVKAMLRTKGMKTTRSKTRTQQEIKSLKAQTGANLNHISNKVAGRIASVPKTKFGLGDAAQIAAPLVKDAY